MEKATIFAVASWSRRIVALKVDATPAEIERLKVARSLSETLRDLGK